MLIIKKKLLNGGQLLILGFLPKISKTRRLFEPLERSVFCRMHEPKLIAVPLSNVFKSRKRLISSKNLNFSVKCILEISLCCLVILSCSYLLESYRSSGCFCYLYQCISFLNIRVNSFLLLPSGVLSKSWLLLIFVSVYFFL